MHIVFQSIAAGCYLFIGILCLLFGANRGHHLKRVNSHVIFFFIYLMAFWYIMNIQANFVLEDWERDDGIQDVYLLRFIAGATIITTFTVLVAYRMKEDSLDLFLHFTICLFTNFFLLMSVIAFEQKTRTVWLIASIVFSIILIIHMIRESMSENVTNPRFVRSIMLFVFFYISIYIASTIWGPLHERLISAIAQETIMVFADVIVSLCCSIPIVHYGWALVHRGETHLIPGQISSTFEQVQHLPTKTTQLRDDLHTFD